MTNKQTCTHPDFRAEVTVARLEDSGRFAADVRIRCTACGVPMRFIGLPAGLDLNGAATSADATEARLAIAPRGEVVPAIDGPVGFSVRRDPAPQTTSDVGQVIRELQDCDRQILHPRTPNVFNRAVGLIEQMRAITEPIERLRADEGNAVCINAQNAEGCGPDNELIEVTADWTNWEPRRFPGATLAEAFAAAERERDRVNHGEFPTC